MHADRCNRIGRTDFNRRADFTLLYVETLRSGSTLTGAC
jgi:hypothetical protein